MSAELNNWSAVSLGFVMRAPVAAFLMLLPLAIHAAKPEPYGEYFVRAGEQWPDARVGMAGVAAATPGSGFDDDASFQRQLSLLEGQGGPYSDALAEPLADLGRYHRQAGDLAAAQQAYQRALHVVRINEGLYSERQVPILRELFELYRMTGDMATLDARYDYYFRLYGSGQPPFSAVRLGAALEYIRWQREAIRLKLTESQTRRLLALHTLNRDLLAAVETDPEVDIALYRELVLSQLRNLYLVERLYEPREDVKDTAATTRMAAAWGEQQDIGEHRLEIIQRRALRRGRELLDGLIARTPEDDTEAIAAAYLELGDWNQWHDRQDEALAAYGQAEQILRESGNETLLSQWLGEPQELPSNGAFWQPKLREPGEDRIIVSARYDVTPKGRADNIETSSATEADERKASRVRRYLGQTRFRPRVVDGVAQSELQLSRDYEVLR